MDRVREPNRSGKRPYPCAVSPVVPDKPVHALVTVIALLLPFVMVTPDNESDPIDSVVVETDNEPDEAVNDNAPLPETAFRVMPPVEAAVNVNVPPAETAVEPHEIVPVLSF